MQDRPGTAVLSCHWGVSSSPESVAYQTKLAQTAIEARPDAMVGHHPHVLQPTAFHQGKPIFYSVGNFVFDWPKMRRRNPTGSCCASTFRADW